MKLFVASLIFLLSAPVLASGAPSLKTEEQYRQDSHRICSEEWTKRGELDRRMYNYCMEQQSEAYQELLVLHKYADQAFYADTAFPYCSKEWTKRGITNVRMTVYCLNQEVEGIRDVMYFREQYGESQVNAIVSSALSRFGSWRMAAYQVKRHFE